MITGFDVIVYALGWVALIYFGWKAGKVLSRVIWGIACACSVVRWIRAMKRAHRMTGFGGLSWEPMFFWVTVSGMKKDRATLRVEQGIWNDVGNWTVFPPKVSE